MTEICVRYVICEPYAGNRTPPRGRPTAPHNLCPQRATWLCLQVFKVFAVSLQFR
jgi:hypothetical protein